MYTHTELLLEKISTSKAINVVHPQWKQSTNMGDQKQKHASVLPHGLYFQN